MTTTTFDQTVDIADRVRRVATEDPTRVALIHATRRLDGRIRYRRFTYRELSDRAESLALDVNDPRRRLPASRQ